MKSFLKPILAAIALSLLALSLVSAPASAHQTEVSQGNDFAVTATDHQSGSVCDMERDGRAVSARWFDDEGFTVGYEEDGGDSGCDEIQFRGTADTVIVCEMILGGPACTDPHKV